MHESNCSSSGSRPLSENNSPELVAYRSGRTLAEVYQAMANHCLGWVPGPAGYRHVEESAYLSWQRKKFPLEE